MGSAPLRKLPPRYAFVSCDNDEAVESSEFEVSDDEMSWIKSEIARRRAVASQATGEQGAPAVAVCTQAGHMVGYITRENIGELMVIRGR